MQEMKAKGETLSWALPGALIGVVVAAIASIAYITVLLVPGSELDPSYGEGFTGVLVRFGIPVVLMLFGALAGALVGAGVPRYNPHPQQGRRRKAYHFIPRWKYGNRH